MNEIIFKVDTIESRPVCRDDWQHLYDYPVHITNIEIKVEDLNESPTHYSI